jgi:hypothetical protein
VTGDRIGDWLSEQAVSAAQQGDPRVIALLVSGSHQHMKRFARDTGRNVMRTKAN